MIKKGFLFVLLLIAVNIAITAKVVFAESTKSFRQQNGLKAYKPPEWFLKSYFIAAEKNPSYIFGPVQDFIAALGGTATWLIEDMELERLNDATAKGKNIEYSFYIEAALPERTEYWGFVVFPYEKIQEWFDARKAFHGRKAIDYYGKTQSELEQALSQGFKIKSELRFWVENGNISLQNPESVIMKKYKLRPVFDLGAGRQTTPDAKSQLPKNN